RVSFRLSFAALFCDIGYSAHLLFNFVLDPTPGFLCRYIPWAIAFFSLSSLFFIVCIALNLHIMFINEYRRHDFENYYFTIAFSSALLLSLLPAAANMYGYDDILDRCWYRDSGQVYNIIWQWVTFDSWIDASILYCAIVVIMVIRKLKFAEKQIDTFDSSSTSRLSSHRHPPPLLDKAMISNVVRRVVCYTVVPVAQTFCTFTETYYYVTKTLLVRSMPLSYNGGSPMLTIMSLIILIDLTAKPLQIKWLRYMLLIKLFSPPKSSPRLFSSELLSPINSFVGNDDTKQDIILDNQNDQGIHLILTSPHCLNPSNSSEPLVGSSKSYQTNQTNINNLNNTNVIDILNFAVNDEGRIDFMNINGEPTKRISEEFSEIEIALRRL
ncbi:3968_t:CDS:2, partial [Dentiscutata heterogama]